MAPGLPKLYLSPPHDTPFYRPHSLLQPSEQRGPPEETLAAPVELGPSTGAWSLHVWRGGGRGHHLQGLR